MYKGMTRVCSLVEKSNFFSPPTVRYFPPSRSRHCVSLVCGCPCRFFTPTPRGCDVLFPSVLADSSEWDSGSTGLPHRRRNTKMCCDFSLDVCPNVPPPLSDALDDRDPLAEERRRTEFSTSFLRVEKFYKTHEGVSPSSAQSATLSQVWRSS